MLVEPLRGPMNYIVMVERDSKRQSEKTEKNINEYVNHFKICFIKK